MSATDDGLRSDRAIPELERRKFYDPDDGRASYVRTINDVTNSNFNTLGSVRTTITTTPTAINIPDDAEQVYLKHIETGYTIWVGEDVTITAGGATAFPLSPGDTFPVRLRSGNDNSLYAVMASDTGYIYALGAFKS
jgi:hypothetical protein